MSTRGRGRGGRGGRGSEAGSTLSRPGSGRGRGRAVTPTYSAQPSPRGTSGFGGSRGRGAPSGPIIYQENIPAHIPSQLDPAALRRLVDNFKTIKISTTRPLRPGFGTAGAPVKLRTNFFAVKVLKTPIYDYVVTIEPNTDLKRLKTRIFQLLEQSPALQAHRTYIAHDYSQRLVSGRQLPQPLQVPLPFYEDNEKKPGPNAKVYTVSITLDRQLDPSELDK